MLPHTAHTRTSARSNLADMIQLHDEILGQLHSIVPFSDYDSRAAVETAAAFRPSHARRISDDGTSPRKPHHLFSHTGWSKRRSLDIKTTLDTEPVILSCSTTTVSEVAKLFARNVCRYTSCSLTEAHKFRSNDSHYTKSMAPDAR